MGKKKSKIFSKKKRSVFARPHPIKRKMKLRQRKMRAFLHKHNPRPRIERGLRRMVGGFYNVSDKVRDKIAETYEDTVQLFHTVQHNAVDFMRKPLQTATTRGNQITGRMKITFMKNKANREEPTDIYD